MMGYRVTILGEPILDIYECENGRCWFITKKTQRHGQSFLSGYVRCFKPLLLAEFHYLPEQVFDDMGKKTWKVSKEAWPRCPCVEIQKGSEHRTIVRFRGRDGDTRPPTFHFDGNTEWPSFAG